MKLRNEISEKERFLSPMCAICDEYAFGRVDHFEWSCVAGINYVNSAVVSRGDNLVLSSVGL